MARGHQTKGVYYKEDRTGKIEYKITYFIEQQVFRVYKQIKNDEGKYAHRFTMKTRHIVDYKKDLSDLKQYIENELIGENSDVVNILPSKPQKESKDDKWVDLKPKKKKTSLGFTYLLCILIISSLRSQVVSPLVNSLSK